MAINKKVLVVDDESKIVEVVRAYLEKDGYIVYSAFEGRKAIELFEEVEPDLIILDLMLPDISGEEICKRLRSKSRVPIIMLTAKVEENNIIQGFSIGADDYVTKPFSPKELIARISALLRRTDGNSPTLTDIISFNNEELVVNIVSHELRKNGATVYLTPGEFNIISTMARYPQKVFTREELVYTALDDEYDGYDRIIDTHIKNIRHKIENNPKQPKYIITVHGVGYKFGGGV